MQAASNGGAAGAAVHTLVCAACSAAKPKTDYSKAQLKKKGDRKCFGCVGEASDGANGGGDAAAGDAAAANGDGNGEGEKKKPKKKKKKSGGGEASKQTSPPTIPMHELFASGNFPAGEDQEYANYNLERTTMEELRAKDAATLDETIRDLRQAAEAHRQVRADVMSWIKPGMLMFDIAERLEAKSR